MGSIILPKGILNKRISLIEREGIYEINVPFKNALTSEQTRQFANHFSQEFLFLSRGFRYTVDIINKEGFRGEYKINPEERYLRMSPFEISTNSFYAIPFNGVGRDVSLIREPACTDPVESFEEYFHLLKSINGK